LVCYRMNRVFVISESQVEKVTNDPYQNNLCLVVIFVSNDGEC
jgi:hypothetical protein